MAENLMATKGVPILHTYSKYANENINLAFINRLNQKTSLRSDIEKMESRERAFYKKYGADSFEEFKKKIMAVFASEDIEVIKRFEASNLQSRLASFALTNKELYEYKEGIKIIIDTTKLKNIKNLKLSTKALQKEGLIIKGDLLELELKDEISVGKLKATMNEVFGRHYHADNVTATQYLDNFITSLTAEGGPLTIQIGKKNNFGKTVYEDEYTRHSIPNFPWGVTKQLWEQAVRDNNRAMLAEMDKAVDRIYRFLYEEIGSGASDKMHQAITNTWDRLFGKDFAQARFFSGGKKNFISAVQGAMGEFQTALLFEYLQLQKMGNAFAEIKGNTIVNSGEQARSDVQIFKSIGIQVKNFNVIETEMGQSFIHDVHTRIHPDKLAKNLPTETQDDFLSFIANFYFNASYEKQQFGKAIELKYALQNWLGAVMNMALKDATKEGGEDNVTFYMFSGKNFVPCSVILKAAEAQGIKDNLVIYSSYYGKTDKEFARKEGEAPLAQTYWTKESGTWQPTDENIAESKNLVGSRISIQTSFNFFDEIEKYALWD